jgi:RNA polymerase sigma-70 factor (ECF subfamily)
VSDPQDPARPGDRPRRGTSLTLLERARNNDAEAWARIVRLYTPLVYHWCGRGGVQGPDAEDVAQEVFQGAVTGLGKFRRDRPGDSFRGWLRGITRNQLLLHYRRSGRQPRASGGSDAFVKLQEVADPQADLPDEDPVPEVQGLYRRALELVRGAFDDRTWQMFWLAAVEGRAPADVAAAFGVSPAAVYKARSRVLHRLKAEVGDLAV